MGQGPPSAGSVGILREAVVYNEEVLGHNVGMVKKNGGGRKKSVSSKKQDAALNELKGFAEGLGVRVREEKLLREVGYRVRGGVCRVHEEEIVFLDRNRPINERIDVLVDELSRRQAEFSTLSSAVQNFFSQSENRPGGQES